MGQPGNVARVRAAEVIGAACLATDLGMGFPFEHGIEATLVSSRLARLLDVDIETESEVFYLSLLVYLGAREVVDDVTAVVAKGGITSAEVAKHGLGARRARVIGQVDNGIPLWTETMPDERQMPLVVPGNMGDRDSINRILGGSEPHPERPKRQRHHPRSASNQSASSSVN